MIALKNPTGGHVRGADKYGIGRYGASRGDERHKGADYLCEPGQEVLSPIQGKVQREALPYADEHYSGLVIENSFMSIKMFYFMPNFSLLGKEVKAGDVIGIAQDISEKHEGMPPHIHLEIDSIDPEVLMT
jgi:hypothetical protein